jgi:hypothetical protein
MLRAGYCGFAVVLILVMSFPSGILAGDASVRVENAQTRASAPWLDYAWFYRMPVTIDNTPNTAALTDYTVQINASVQNLISAGKMKSDRSDVRFTDTDGTTPLAHWINADGIFWVKVPNIPAGTTKSIFMYYGNPMASNASNGAAAFFFFDNFDNGTIDTTKWEIVNGTWTIVQDGGSNVLKGAGEGGSSYFRKCIRMKLPNDTTLQNFAAEMDWRDQDATSLANFIYRAQSTNFQDCDRWWIRLECRSTYTIGLHLLKSVSGSVSYECVIPLGSVTTYNHYSLNVFDTTHRLGVKGVGTVDKVYSNVNQAGYMGFQIECNAMYLDNFFIRKCTPNEPAAGLGQEELPFKFISMSHSPSTMNIGETVFFNATFNNPSPNALKIQLAAREADNFNDTVDNFYEEQVSLEPSTDATFHFTWTAVGGPHTIWLAVHDHPFASAKLKVNRDPVIAPVKDQSLRQDRDFILQVNASDPDGDSLNWSIDNPLFNISSISNRSAQISFLPTNEDVGVHRANITVQDPMNRSDTRRINFTVNNVNDPPVLTKIPSLSATQYKELRYQAEASDPDLKWGDLLTFSDNTDLFDIDAKTGEFYFTPIEEQVGKYSIKITVMDIEGASETASFTITVANVNDPPTIEMLPLQFALQGRLFQLKIVAADPDLKSDPTEKLRFSDDSTLFNINNDTGLISFTPTNDQLGIWIANITVTDKGGLSSTTSLTITVMNANDPPSLEAIPAQTATEGVPFQYQTNASDPDLKWGLDNLTFTDDTDIFNIDSKTGAISFTPTGAQIGIKRVTITVKDEKSASASASFDLTVVHVNHPPTDAAIKYPLDGARLKEGDAMWLDGTAKDSDKGDVLQYSWLDNGEPAGTGKNISVKLKPGKHTIALEVSDGSETVSTEISVEVEKKETVTVASGGFDWLPLAAAAAAAVAIVAIIAVLAARRRRKHDGPEASEEARVPLEDEAAVDKMIAPAAPKKVAVKKKKTAAAKAKDTTAKKGKTASAVKRCPGCGEELEAAWPVCPSCGHDA